MPQKGEIATVSGFGATSQGGDISLTLKEVNLEIWSNPICQVVQWIGLFPIIITDNMLCAGNLFGGMDSCQGDSGGPLVTKVNGRYEVSGIVSFGKGCARPFHPGIYANTFALSEWIKITTGSGECPRDTQFNWLKVTAK